jgi:hypothetical protein
MVLILKLKDILPDWTTKQDTTITSLQGTHITSKDTETKRMKNYIHVNGIQMQVGVAIFILNKADISQKY